ncbi:MAG: CDP-diacylglycerol--glycerol-3-phosphate 3-phosphatidyltransferase [Planctomycetota bacterium]
MNLANKITTSRILLSFVLFAMLSFLEKDSRPKWWFLTLCGLLFIGITATDALDGYVARRLKQVSDFGRIADPAADKIAICGTFIFLTALPWAPPVLPPWVVVVIVAREFVVSGIRGFFEARGQSFASDWAGKTKMISQCVAIPSVLFYKIIDTMAPDLSSYARVLSQVLVGLAALLTLYSGVNYIRKAAALLKHDAW